MRFPKSKIFLLVLFIYLAALLYLNHESPLLYWDENTYLSNARGVIGESHYTEEFRFPLLSWTIALLWSVTGESILAAKILVILISVGCAYLFHIIATEHLGRKKALIALILFCGNFLAIEWGFRIYTDMPGLALILLGYCVLLKRTDLFGYLAAGLLFGAGFLMRFTYAIFPLAAGLAILISLARKRRVREVNRGLSLVLGFLVAITPWLIYNKIRHKNLLWNIIQQFNITQMQQVEPVSAQLFYILVVLGLLAILAPIGMYGAVRQREEKLYTPSIFIIIYAAYIVFIVHIKDPRYVLPLLPFAIILGYYALQNLLKNPALRFCTLLLLIGFTCVASVTLVGNILMQGRCSGEGGIMQSIEFLEANTEQGDAIASNIWPWFGYYNNLEARSLWTTDMKKYYERHRAKYIIHHDGMGEYFDRTLIEGYEKATLEKQFNACNGGIIRIYSLG